MRILLMLFLISLTGCTVIVKHEPQETPIVEKEIIYVDKEPVVVEVEKIKYEKVYCGADLLQDIDMDNLVINKELYQKNQDVIGYVKVLEDNNDILSMIVERYNKNQKDCQ